MGREVAVPPRFVQSKDLSLPSLPYPQYFGGVSALTPDQYLKMNGFPNEYWGWGGEDDDIATRSDFLPPPPSFLLCPQPGSLSSEPIPGHGILILTFSSRVLHWARPSPLVFLVSPSQACVLLPIPSSFSPLHLLSGPWEGG